jgi:hypothetical protein
LMIWIYLLLLSQFIYLKKSLEDSSRPDGNKFNIEICNMPSSVTHSWSHSKTLYSSPMDQLKQLYLFQRCPVTDPTLQRCYSNITLLKFDH